MKSPRYHFEVKQLGGPNANTIVGTIRRKLSIGENGEWLVTVNGRKAHVLTSNGGIKLATENWHSEYSRDSGPVCVEVFDLPRDLDTYGYE